MAGKNRKRATFIGLDLAWSPGNPSGGAVIRHGRLIAHEGGLGDDGEILQFIQQHMPTAGPIIVAVDAPLRVPNQDGSRRCDRELSREWRRFQAGALPANRRLVARNGVVRGEALVEMLVRHFRFREEAPISRFSQDRLICEVYPHPAMISLFDLERTLKYKARKGRDMETRWAEFEKYQDLLRGLRKADPPLKGTKALLRQVDVRQLRGKRLKTYEDTLDAITCAYVASYFWEHGPRHAVLYGSVPEGHILVPLTKQMRERLSSV